MGQIIRIDTKTQTEFELTQEIAFKLGYSWTSSGKTIIPPVTPSHHYLSLWSDKHMTMGEYETLSNPDFNGNISFEGFLNYVEETYIPF